MQVCNFSLNWALWGPWDRLFSIEWRCLTIDSYPVSIGKDNFVLYIVIVPVYQNGDGHDDTDEDATAHQNNQQSEQVFAQVEARVNDIVDITAFLEEVFDWPPGGMEAVQRSGLVL